jgi:hypothetical protein
MSRSLTCGANSAESTEPDRPGSHAPAREPFLRRSASCTMAALSGRRASRSQFPRRAWEPGGYLVSAAEIPLFSAAALAVLDSRPYDPLARGSYELMSGGLMWPDEFPRPGSPEWAEISPNWVYRYLIAHRASITLGEERVEFRAVWEQVVQFASRWPGLREDRRGELARRRLLAARRRQARCLEELDRYLETKNHE